MENRKVRRSASLACLLSVAALMSALCGCSKSSDDPDGTADALANAKVAYAMVLRLAGYSDPSKVKALGISTTTTTAASNDQTTTSGDGSFSCHTTTTAANFSTYPQDRTYVLKFTSFIDSTSGYTASGSVTANLHFINTSGSVSVTAASISYDLTLSGGSCDKISGSGSAADYGTSGVLNGSVTVDGVTYTTAQLQ